MVLEKVSSRAGVPEPVYHPVGAEACLEKISTWCLPRDLPWLRCCGQAGHRWYAKTMFSHRFSIANLLVAIKSIPFCPILTLLPGFHIHGNEKDMGHCSGRLFSSHCVLKMASLSLLYLKATRWQDFLRTVSRFLASPSGL